MKKMLLLALLVTSATANAAPSVFVRGSPGSSWWNRPMEARILGRAIGAVSAERLSAYIEETQIFSPYRICALEAAAADTYVGMDRATQAEIDATRPLVQWRIESAAPDGRRVTGQIALFEGCEAEGPRGAALLVTDSATGDILRWEPLGDRLLDNGTSAPAWVMFLYPRGEDELFGYSGCAECGARMNVYYDVTRRRIYTEHNGH